MSRRHPLSERPRAGEEERGSQLAELGILLPALVPLLFGPLALQRFYGEYQGLSQVAAEGARLAAVAGAGPAHQRIEEMLRAAGLEGAQWRIEGPTGWGTPVRVTVSRVHRLTIPLLWERNLELSVSREARSERP